MEPAFAHARAPAPWLVEMPEWVQLKRGDHMSDLVLYTPPNLALMPANPSKDTKYRIGKFTTWLAENGGKLFDPDIAAYRDFLLSLYARATASAHLSTIRAAYRRILRDNDLRSVLYEKAIQTMGDQAHSADLKAFVDEAFIRLNNELDPDKARVKTEIHQDRPDAAQIRLTKEQAELLLAAPGVSSLPGLRDTAIIALMLCTGLREAELCGLDVSDLRQTLGGELALSVRLGKGSKSRLIPYGDLSWCLVIVDKWLERAGISEGPVFRGIHNGGRKLRSGRLTTRAVQYILSDYRLAINGKPISVKPHDLRRTYARRMYDSGIDLLSIQQNLGHADSKTTLKYIGTLSAEKRRAPAMYSFDLRKLEKAEY